MAILILVDSSLVHPWNSGVTLAFFHSFGKISASIQLLKMYAKDGPTILLDSFKSLQGILSNPVAFLRPAGSKACIRC